MKQMKRFLALPLCFLLLIAAFTAAFFALPKQTFAENEKRLLSEPPRFSWTALLDGSLTEEAQIYLADHFPLREAFVGLHAYWELLLGQNGDSGVYQGKDGYLFTKQGNVDLAKETQNIETIRAFAQRNGLSTTWLIVPCAGGILHDKLPRFHTSFRDGELLDAAKAACVGDTFIDLRGVFAENADKQLYYKTDHHLTADGSLVLYDAYCKANDVAPRTFTLMQTSDGFYGTAYSKSGLWLTKPDSLELYSEPDGDYTVTITEGSDETVFDSLFFPDHLNEKDQYPVFLDGNHALVKIQNNRCQNGRKLLILKDSFAHCFATFLAAEYETIYMVDLRYHRSPVADLLRYEGIQDLLVLYGAENLATSTDIPWLSMLG